MYDLHTHSILSDGALLPMELAKRYASKGYQVIALTDHVDFSNVDSVILGTIKVCDKINTSSMGIKVIPGVEVTHVPVEDIKSLVGYVRDKGIKLVVGHGETIIEPVAKNTNKALAEAEVDIISHPGLINNEVVELCAKKGIFLEVTARRGHSLTNGHVVKLAEKYKTKLLINTDSHEPCDILSIDMLKQVGIGSGLSLERVDGILQLEREFIKNISV